MQITIKNFRNIKEQSLAVSKGEFTILLGQSSTGKTNILKSISEILALDELENNVLFFQQNASDFSKPISIKIKTNYYHMKYEVNNEGVFSKKLISGSKEDVDVFEYVESFDQTWTQAPVLKLSELIEVGDNEILEEIFKNLVPTINTVSFGHNGLVKMEDSKGKILNWETLSKGTQKILSIFIDILWKDLKHQGNVVFMIDDLETFIDVEDIMYLSNFIDGSEQKILFSSHSPILYELGVVAHNQFLIYFNGKFRSVSEFPWTTYKNRAMLKVKNYYDDSKWTEAGLNRYPSYD